MAGINVGDIQAVFRVIDEASGPLQRIAGETRKAETTFGSMAKTALAFGAGMIGATSAMALVSSAFGTVKDAAFGTNAMLETTTLQFETLMGSADQAKTHVAGLFEIAKKTPFETGPIVAASLKLQTFGGIALNTKENLMLIGDAAAATNAPINELGMWVGRLYASIQAGRPFGEAAMRLQELAVMTPQTRQKMEDLQKAGASAAEVFDTFKDSLGTFTGAMGKQAATWTGVISTFKDTVNLSLAGIFRPIFEDARDALAGINAWLESNEATLTRWGLEAQAVYQRVKTALMQELWPVVQRVGAAMKDVWDAAQPAVKAFAGVLWDVLILALRAVGTAVDAVVGAVTTLKAWFDDLPGPVKALVVDLGLLAAAVWAVNTAIVALKATSAGITLASSFGWLREVLQMIGAFGVKEVAVLMVRNLAAAVGALTAPLTTVAGLFTTGAAAGAVYLDTMAGAITNGKGMKSLQEDIATVLGGRTTPAVRETSEALADLTHSAQENEAEWWIQATAAREANDALGTVAGSLDAATRAALKQAPAVALSGDAAAKAAAEFKKLQDAQDAMSGQAAIAAVEAQLDVYRRLVAQGLAPTREAAVELVDALDAITAIASETGRRIPPAWAEARRALVETATRWDAELGHMALTAEDFVARVTQVGQEIAPAIAGSAIQGLQPFMTALPKAVQETQKLAVEGAKAATQTGSAFKDGLGKAADVIDLLSRTAEMAGHKTTAALLSTASATAKAFATGGPWAAAITAASGLITSLWSKIFGSATSKADHAATKAIQQLQADLLRTYGSLEAIARAGGAAGAELVAAWGDRSQAGLKHFQELLDQFNGKVADSRAELALLQQQLADRTVMDWERAQEVIEKYGGTLDDLGGKFTAAKLAADWKSIWDDWETLIDMGADVGGTLVTMKDEIEALVQASIKIGTEMPEQFKPLIAELIRTGQLFDANGQAITDIGDLTFGAPLVSEVDKIIAAIDRLITALTVDVPDAFEVASNIRVPPIKIPYEFDPLNELPTGPSGPSGGAYDMPQFSEGTDGQYLNFGRGTPVMLHGWEAVVPREQIGGALPAAPAAGGEQTIIVPVNIDGRPITEVIIKRLGNRLAVQGLVRGTV